VLFRSDAETFCGLAPFIPPELIKALPQLKWIQALTTGVDNLLKMECLPSSVVLTSCKGFHGPQMSELAILLMLSLARRFPAMLDNQKRAEWHRWPQPLLEGKTVCIVGLGGISEALAKRCLPFGMRITGVSDGRTQVDGVDRIYRRAEMKSAAADCDFLVVLVPYSEATHHLINADVLAAMKPAAHLINISRGGCVDEAAVINAVNSGVIASAGLDVFGGRGWHGPWCLERSHRVRRDAEGSPRPSSVHRRPLGCVQMQRGRRSTPRRRSEERRVGKECRSRWSPYH